MVSIIIPAHNEASVISSCLTPFIKACEQGDIEVIIVCNGCTDETDKVVSQLNNKFICIETNVPSKTNALNLGDKKAKYYPRIYLDADVAIDFDAIVAMCNELQHSDCLATSVEVKMDMSKSYWFVCAFYEIWLSLPYCKAGMIGSGVYALSREARERFDQFPDLIADDGYIRCLFKESERTVTKGHYSIVTAPKDLMSLIKIKTRSRLGRYQLKERFPELLANETKDYQGALRGLFFKFKLWPKLFVYLGVNVISRIRARYQYLTKQTKWERDDSSRS